MGHTNFPSITLWPMGFKGIVPCSYHGAWLKVPCDGRSGEATNLNLFDHPFPCHLGVDNEFILDTVLDLGLMPLFMVEHFVLVALNP
jgi:hypothetical protein